MWFENTYIHTYTVRVTRTISSLSRNWSKLLVGPDIFCAGKCRISRQFLAQMPDLTKILGRLFDLFLTKNRFGILIHQYSSRINTFAVCCSQFPVFMPAMKTYTCRINVHLQYIAQCMKTVINLHRYTYLTKRIQNVTVPIQFITGNYK